VESTQEDDSSALQQSGGGFLEICSGDQNKTAQLDSTPDSHHQALSDQCVDDIVSQEYDEEKLIAGSGATGFKGVLLSKDTGKFRVQLYNSKICGSSGSLLQFGTAKEAAWAYYCLHNAFHSTYQESEAGEWIAHKLHKAPTVTDAVKRFLKHLGNVRTRFVTEIGGTGTRAQANDLESARLLETDKLERAEERALDELYKSLDELEAAIMSFTLEL